MTITEEQLRKAIEAPAKPDLSPKTAVDKVITGSTVSITGAIATTLINYWRAKGYLTFIPEGLDLYVAIGLSGVLGSVALILKQLYKVLTFNYEKWVNKYGIAVS